MQCLFLCDGCKLVDLLTSKFNRSDGTKAREKERERERERERKEVNSRRRKGREKWRAQPETSAGAATAATEALGRVSHDKQAPLQ
jgi:hypothetical protein